MTVPPLRIVFAGTPDFAAAHLAHLVQHKHEIVSAYSQPDRPSGRGKQLQPSPVKLFAQQHGIAVQQPVRFDQEAITTLAALQADLMVVVAYGLILPKAVLALPRLGCINVHASLLPRWRGAAPIERAILAGDSETGVSIMQMEAGLDTGPVFGAAATPIHATDNSESLGARLQQLGCQALEEVLQRIAAGTAHAEPQQEAQACYARKLDKSEAAINWSSPAVVIDRQIRAFFPRSPAYCLYHDQRFRILSARVVPAPGSSPPGTIVATTPTGIVVACGQDALELERVQLEGKNPVSPGSLRNGHPGLLLTGQQLLSAHPDATSPR